MQITRVGNYNQSCRPFYESLPSAACELFSNALDMLPSTETNDGTGRVDQDQVEDKDFGLIFMSGYSCVR